MVLSSSPSVRRYPGCLELVAAEFGWLEVGRNQMDGRVCGSCGGIRCERLRVGSLCCAVLGRPADVLAAVWSLLHRGTNCADQACTCQCMFLVMFVSGCWSVHRFVHGCRCCSCVPLGAISNQHNGSQAVPRGAVNVNLLPWHRLFARDV